jgi:hypothetical protein
VRAEGVERRGRIGGAGSIGSADELAAGAGLIKVYNIIKISSKTDQPMLMGQLGL